MTYSIFLDDERYPKYNHQYIIMRSYAEAVAYVQTTGLPAFVSFDHDLGTDETGYDFAKFLVDYMIANEITEMFEWHVHSANPVGAHNINSYLMNYAQYLDNQLE